jgi:hypothetical protein
MFRLLTALLISSSVLLQASADLTLAQSNRTSKHRTPPTRKSQVKMPCDMGIDASVESGIVDRPEWSLAAESKDEAFYYNTKWICVHNIVRVWIKSLLKESDDPPQFLPRDTISKQSATSIARYELRCKAGQTRVTQAVEYDTRGRVTHSRSTPSAKWEEVVPDSIGEGILKSVCEGEPLPHIAKPK